MNKLLILAVFATFAGIWVGAVRLVEKWGTPVLIVAAFSVITLLGIHRLYRYGADHKNG